MLQKVLCGLGFHTGKFSVVKTEKRFEYDTNNILDGEPYRELFLFTTEVRYCECCGKRQEKNKGKKI